MDVEPNEVDCERAWRLIEQVCGGGLPGRVALALRRHLADCPDCNAHYRARVRETAELARALSTHGSAPGGVGARSGAARRRLRRRRTALTFLVACFLIAAVARLDGDWEFDPSVTLEWRAGEVWAGGALVGADAPRAVLERSDLVLTDLEGRAHVRARSLELELEPGVRLLVVSATARRLRLEEGRVVLRGEGRLETPRGFVAVDGGEAEVSVDTAGLRIRALSGRGERIDARGTVRVAPEPSVRAG
jgi:hypothetical protein